MPEADEGISAGAGILNYFLCPSDQQRRSASDHLSVSYACGLKGKKDCLFIDSEEATTEQLRFISKVKRLTAETARKPDAGNIDLDPYQQDNGLVIPAKFSHVDLEALMQARTQTDELKEVLGRVHPWSSLRYGYAAVDMVEKLYQGIIPK